MRDAVQKEVYTYSDEETVVSTTDKYLAILIYEYAKIKTTEKIDKAIIDLVETLGINTESRIEKPKKTLKTTNAKRRKK